MYENRLDGVQEAEHIMHRLYTSFVEVAKQDKSAPLMKNTQQVYAGMTYARGAVNEDAGLGIFVVETDGQTMRAQHRVLGRDLKAWSAKWLEESGINTIAADIKTNANGTIVMKDVAGRYGIRDIATLEKLSRYLFSTSGNLFSICSRT